MQGLNLGSYNRPRLTIDNIELLNVDVVDNKYIDICADFSKGLVMPCESQNLILCSHALEHQSRTNVASALFDMCRMLKIDGKLILIVPDVIRAFEHYMQSPHKPEAEIVLQQHVYGHGTRTTWNYHPVAIMQERITRLMSLYGMYVTKAKRYVSKHNTFELKIEGIKTKHIEKKDISSKFHSAYCDFSSIYKSFSVKTYWSEEAIGHEIYIVLHNNDTQEIITDFLSKILHSSYDLIFELAYFEYASRILYRLYLDGVFVHEDMIIKPSNSIDTNTS